MRRFIIVLILMPTAFIFSTSANQETPSGGNLTVRISGCEVQAGKIRLALCRSEEEFTASDSVFRSAIQPAEIPVTFYTFRDIPFAVYAIKTFHDENDNGRMDTNFLGIPVENYGFSNNARGTFGPPSWSEARFDFSQTTDTLDILVE